MPAKRSKRARETTEEEQQEIPVKVDVEKAPIKQEDTDQNLAIVSESNHKEEASTDTNNSSKDNDDVIVYILDEDLSLCDLSLFVRNHAMKPWRLTPTHELVLTLPGVKDALTIVKPPKLSLAELMDFHSPAYIRQLCLHNQQAWCWDNDTPSKIRFSGDCPPVEGIVEFIAGVAAASLQGAILLNKKKCKTAINWAGGLHHAKAGDCSGFCYVNDIVIAIIELLKAHRRVFYIDLDVHHGDGVEEAFLFTDRVFTLSLHKYADGFFPGTGHLHDIGMGGGRYYKMNLPLPDGVEDCDYVAIFQLALEMIAEKYRPEVVVLQCGADSLAGDRVGTFNLSSVGHGRCVSIVKELNLPLLVLGGGGYSVRNVARLWAYETAVLCGCVEEIGYIDLGKANGDGEEEDEVLGAKDRQPQVPVHKHTPVPANLPSSWLFDLSTNEEERVSAMTGETSTKKRVGGKGSVPELPNNANSSISHPGDGLPRVTLHVPPLEGSMLNARTDDDRKMPGEYNAQLDSLREQIIFVSNHIEPVGGVES